MAKYKVEHTSILHNGKLYKEGSIIELDDKHAVKLADFIECLPNQTTAKPKTQNNTQNKGQTSKNTNKSKSETKTETKTPDTSKDEKGDSKGTEQDGGVDDDK